MSAYTGRQGRGAATQRRKAKRLAAEQRNAATPPQRRRAARRKCPTGKVKYLTEQEARTELVGTVVAKNAGRGHRHECRWYACPMCKGWHLTSQPAKPTRRRTDTAVQA